MLTDVIVDTNVLLHADNPEEARQGEAVNLVRALVTGPTAVCVDEGFSPEEGDNRSLIGGEYLDKLTAVSLGYQMLVHVFSEGRIVEVSTSVSDQVRGIVRKAVNKPRDRTFLRVAYNSKERVLCSHDYEDFPARARRQLQKRLDVTVCDAADACGRL